MFIIHTRNFAKKCLSQKAFLQNNTMQFIQNPMLLLLSSLHYNGMNQVNTIEPVHPNENTRA